MLLCVPQVGSLKADFAAKLQAAENRVRDFEAARDEAKQQAAALAQELEDSKKTAQQVGGGWDDKRRY